MDGADALVLGGAPNAGAEKSLNVLCFFFSKYHCGWKKPIYLLRNCRTERGTGWLHYTANVVSEVKGQSRETGLTKAHVMKVSRRENSK